MAPQRIAILDNDPAQLAILAELLESEGYAVATLANLHQGDVFVKACRPALVILDLVQDRQPLGLELLRVLRTDPQTREVAILVVSAEARPSRPTRTTSRPTGSACSASPMTSTTCLVSSANSCLSTSWRPTRSRPGGAGQPVSVD